MDLDRLDYNYIYLFLLNLGLLLYKAGSFLTTAEFAGRDLVGAYSLVEAFQFGWTNNWFLGFEMFRFYPPGFFGLTKALGVLVTDLIAFKLLVFLSLLTLPLAIYYCFKSIYNRDTALIAGFLGLSIIFLRDPLSMIYQTLQVGLVAQAFALVLLFLFMGNLWKEGRGHSYLSAVLLGLIVVSHPFVAVVASLYLLSYLLLTRNLGRTLVASIGYAMSAWWWIPFMENMWYAQLYTGPSGKLVNLPWILLPFLLLDRSRRALSIILPGILLVLLGTFELVPIQYYRFFTYGQVLLVAGAAPGIKEAVDKTPELLDSRHLTYMIGASIILAALLSPVNPRWSSSVTLEDVTPGNGKIIVETSHGKMHQSYVPIQRVPLESNATVVNGLYADSSISSPYLLGLEKSISSDPVPNPIAVESDLNRTQLEKRMDYLDIEYALVRTENARQKLGFMEKVSKNKDYTLLHHTPEFPEVQKDVITVSGPRSEWEELNRHLFRSELVTNILYLHGREGDYSLEELDSQEITRKAKVSDSGRSIRIQPSSIRIEEEKEGIFGLRAR